MKINKKIEKINSELLSYSNDLKKRLTYDLYKICKEYNISENSNTLYNHSPYIDCPTILSVNCLYKTIVAKLENIEEKIERNQEILKERDDIINHIIKKSIK